MNEATHRRKKRLKLLAAAIIAGVVALGVLAYIFLFVVPKPVAFSYAGETCVWQPTVLPGAMRETSDSGYVVGYKDGLTVGSLPLVTFSTCFYPATTPSEGTQTVSVAPFGIAMAQHHFQLEVPPAPTADTAAIDGQVVAVTRALEIPLASPDRVFVYKVSHSDQQSDCTVEEALLRCHLSPFDLRQGEQYEMTLHRYFVSELVQTLGSGEITTLKALKLKKASVKDGQTVYGKPKSFTFTFDKELTGAEATLEKKTKKGYETVASTTTTSGKTVSVTPADTLSREHEFKLTLKKVESVDGSVLADEKRVDFTMSGGPKVAGINIGGYGIAPSGTIIVTFDQKVDNWNDISKFVTLSGISGQVNGSGKQLTISYSGGTCDSFSVTVKKGLESTAGVKQDDEWRFEGRTRCYSLQTIGSSHQGRAINAYIFGSGSRTILFTGAIHGNEYSARDLMYAWINELDANIGQVPKGTKVIVVPVVNPDGIAAGSRYNSRGVDLNRNYDTSDWQGDTQTVTGAPLPGGGGSSPMSEKETKALANYTSALRPTLTMSYHAQAAYAIGNQCGNSASKAATYSKLSGYQNMTGVGGAFSYEITGTYDDWICERLGLPSVLIELATQFSAEFARNQGAMWAMVR